MNLELKQKNGSTFKVMGPYSLLGEFVIDELIISANASDLHRYRLVIEGEFNLAQGMCMDGVAASIKPRHQQPAKPMQLVEKLI